ncbi:DUF1036 domain-containing protein [Ammoniphilus sp. 3BR4]|uniref:DUF1036 domain-containing protein n=1 Tax=Ammoniphilus sp. 3BR4 TaxID=3158265 RepID=UPI003467D141
MAVYVRNSTDEVVSVAIGFRDSSCGTKGKAPWRKAGWWNVNPGERRQILTGDSDGRHYFFYAEGKFGRLWNGPYGTSIPRDRSPFNWCWDLACTPGCKSVGFRRTRTSNATNFTITLIPRKKLKAGKAKLGQNRMIRYK